MEKRKSISFTAKQLEVLLCVLGNSGDHVDILENLLPDEEEIKIFEKVHERLLEANVKLNE